MKLAITEYLAIDTDSEQWECRSCGHSLTAIAQNYKFGTLVYDRDPREIHHPRLDPKRYAYTYAPDPDWCRILEYYCPSCGTMIETEYTVPGHPPVMDIEFDVEALKKRAAELKSLHGSANMELPVPDPARIFSHGHSHPAASTHKHTSEDDHEAHRS